jgi:hypothetical protein
MATTSNTYTGNGTNKLFSITFPYLETTDVDVYLNGTLQTAYTFANATTIEFTTAPTNGATVLLNRSTDDAEFQTTFFPGSSIKAGDLNLNFDQVIYIAQETANTANSALSTATTASTNATNAVNTANNAADDASEALSTANTASSNASTALSTANTASTNASSAVTTANTASTNASSAVTTANAAAADATEAVTTAQTASDNIDAAVITANLAKDTSDQAIILADQALNQGAKSFGVLYDGTSGSAGSKIINLGGLVSSCASDYFIGEEASVISYSCAIGCASYSLGTI